MVPRGVLYHVHTDVAVSYRLLYMIQVPGNLY
jgi:hypothetical protein